MLEAWYGPSVLDPKIWLFGDNSDSLITSLSYLFGYCSTENEPKTSRRHSELLPLATTETSTLESSLLSFRAKNTFSHRAIKFLGTCRLLWFLSLCDIRPVPTWLISNLNHLTLFPGWSLFMPLLCILTWCPFALSVFTACVGPVFILYDAEKSRAHVPCRLWPLDRVHANISARVVASRKILRSLETYGLLQGRSCRQIAILVLVAFHCLRE